MWVTVLNHTLPENWGHSRFFLETESDLLAIRRAAPSGRTLGPAEFIKELESGTQRRLTPLKGGRPRKNATKATDRNFGRSITGRCGMIPKPENVVSIPGFPGFPG